MHGEYRINKQSPHDNNMFVGGLLIFFNFNRGCVRVCLLRMSHSVLGTTDRAMECVSLRALEYVFFFEIKEDIEKV